MLLPMCDLKEASIAQRAFIELKSLHHDNISKEFTLGFCIVRMHTLDKKG
jgi:hypothetical protein